MSCQSNFKETDIKITQLPKQMQTATVNHETISVHEQKNELFWCGCRNI